jgi:uncharacterized protein (DUF2141 family)
MLYLRVTAFLQIFRPRPGGNNLLLLVAIFSLVATARAAELTVTVDNIRSDSGVIRLSFYTSSAEWPRQVGQ